MSKAGLIIDRDRDLVNITNRGGLAMSDSAETAVTEGRLFEVFRLEATLANNGNLDIHFSLPTDDGSPGNTTAIQPLAEFAIGGDALAELYVGPTITPATGVALTPNNRNSQSANVSNVTVLANPTVVSPGTLRNQRLILGGSGGQATGGGVQTGRRIIGSSSSLDVTFLVRLKNESGQARRAISIVNWIEEFRE